MLIEVAKSCMIQWTYQQYNSIHTQQDYIVVIEVAESNSIKETGQKYLCLDNFS